MLNEKDLDVSLPDIVRKCTVADRECYGDLVWLAWVGSKAGGRNVPISGTYALAIKQNAAPRLLEIVNAVPAEGVHHWDVMLRNWCLEWAGMEKPPIGASFFYKTHGHYVAHRSGIEKGDFVRQEWWGCGEVGSEMWLEPQFLMGFPTQRKMPAWTIFEFGSSWMMALVQGSTAYNWKTWVGTNNMFEVDPNITNAWELQRHRQKLKDPNYNPLATLAIHFATPPEDKDGKGRSSNRMRRDARKHLVVHRARDFMCQQWEAHACCKVHVPVFRQRFS